MLSLPAVLSAAAPDDVTNTMLANPVAELAVLRRHPPLTRLPALRNLSGGGAVVAPALTRHYDAVVTFRGLGLLSSAEKALLSLGVHVFAPANGSEALATQGWQGQGGGNPGWVGGRVTAKGQGGGAAPLALRAAQEELEVRVLVDGSIIEVSWLGRPAPSARPPPSASTPPVLTSLAHIHACRPSGTTGERATQRGRSRKPHPRLG
jgi:hypothetical protein